MVSPYVGIIQIRSQVWADSPLSACFCKLPFLCTSIPQFFIQQELQHDGLTELIVTRDMAERKTKMIELGDAFIAFPGGTGTLEEIAEVMSRVSLGQLDAPCILYDLNGYYDSLKALLDKMIEKGLSTPQRQQGIRFAANLEEITTILNKA